MASVGNSPHGLVEWSWIVIVQSLGFQKGLDGGGGLPGVVVGHFVEQVVCDVGGTNFVVEKVKDSVGTVNGTQGTLDPGPFAFPVLGNGRISVLQPSVENQPSIDDKVWVPVPKKDG